jgi:hypothetical protein
VTLPVFIDPGLLTGVCGILVGLIGLLALRSHRLATAKAHAEVRSLVGRQEAEWSGRIEQLELRTPTTLGNGRREMRLIAAVSRTLTPK